MGLGFENSLECKTIVDLQFKTEIWGIEHKGKKESLIKLLKKWKAEGKTIPLFYHPSLHLVIVRFDHTVPAALAKSFYECVQKLDYDFQVYIHQMEAKGNEF